MQKYKKFNNPILIQPTRELPKWLGIIGAGTIGPDIAYYLKSAIPDLKLVLIDINQEALDNAVDRISAYADKGTRAGPGLAVSRWRPRPGRRRSDARRPRKLVC